MPKWNNDGPIHTEKIGLLVSCLSRSLKVIDIDTDRSDDFLLVIHVNYGPIPYCFRDNGRFRSKQCQFLLSAYILNARLRVLDFEFCKGAFELEKLKCGP